MVDWTKPVQTKSGCKVRVLTTEMNAGLPVVGIVTCRDGSESVETWSLEGSFMDTVRTHHYDVVNVPEKRRLKGFVNVYTTFHSSIFPTRDAADDNAVTCRRIACVEIDQEYEV